MIVKSIHSYHSAQNLKLCLCIFFIIKLVITIGKMYVGFKDFVFNFQIFGFINDLIKN